MSWVVITGAKGLGEAIAYELASKGHNLILHYRESKKEVEELAEKISYMGREVETIYGDFSSKEGIDAFLSLYQKRKEDVKGMVHSAGPYGYGKSFLTIEKKEWEELWHTHVVAPLLLLKKSPFLQKEKGTTLFMGVAGLHSPRVDKEAPVYFSIKHHLFMMMKSLARELAPKGATVNMVSPGYVEGSEGKAPFFPMGRAGEKEEVARVVSFLFDPGSRFITGQNIEVAGGLRL